MSLQGQMLILLTTGTQERNKCQQIKFPHRLQICLANTELSYFSQRAKDSIFHRYNPILCMQCCCHITDPNSCTIKRTIRNFVPINILLTITLRDLFCRGTDVLAFEGDKKGGIVNTLLYCISDTQSMSLLDSRLGLHICSLARTRESSSKSTKQSLQSQFFKDTVKYI